eukprot:CAMPEP_0201281772 /NCGR_PEP_ID=MMETSP1317-20130820/3994_1 /ASSEMBLY_ACC=CAM_ASM_000770 /TAXON_ID=187299 /ORGANISM="Undescribed Undescribed, Strain Undescribed" /LENGTH=130 /DNA_ID=CAMNT_0047592569 /DNA_START=98 /DNA_END=490 /DNA_ORIENTATION=-
MKYVTKLAIMQIVIGMMDSVIVLKIVRLLYLLMACVTHNAIMKIANGIIGNVFVVLGVLRNCYKIVYVIPHATIKIVIGIMGSVKLRNVHLGVQCRISEMEFVTQNALERNVSVMEGTARNVHLGVRFSG